MTRAEFARGLVRIAVGCRLTLDDATAEVYAEALADQTTADEWEAFTRAAVASGRWRFFPTLAEVLDVLREHRGERPPEAEAAEAYERVLAAGEYTPGGGTTWTFRRIAETCGRAAADAFLAAGGDAAFRTTWDEPKRRERFVREYATAVRCDPATRLLTASPRLALAAGDERAEPSRDEAQALLRIVGQGGRP